MDTIIRNEISLAAENFAGSYKNLRQKNVVVGFDGFIDVIIHPVATRKDKNKFERIETITEFSERIASAAGKSANIEFVPLLEKIGGNGPLMAMAMYNTGSSVTNIGLLGYPDILPVFRPMGEKCRLISVGNPGHTDAIEFDDGKLMLGKLEPLKDMCLKNLNHVFGEGNFIKLLSGADLVACTNWTMLTEMEEILEYIITNLPPAGKVKFFFDLADPEKRTDQDKTKLLQQLAELNKKAGCILGLNFREAEQVLELLEINTLLINSSSGLQQSAAMLKKKLGIYGVVIHALDCAGASLGDEEAGIPGPYCKKPSLTTGGGDHFNGGFCSGLLAGLNVKDALYIAVATSGWYVRNKRSPNPEGITELLLNWMDGRLTD